MTLRATLAERLGFITAADADRREAEEHRTIDRRMHLLRGGSVRVAEIGSTERGFGGLGHTGVR